MTNMNKQRPLILIALMLYIFFPAIAAWLTHESGSWYRPFALWLAVIFVAFLLQLKGRQHDL